MAIHWTTSSPNHRRLALQRLALRPRRPATGTPAATPATPATTPAKGADDNLDDLFGDSSDSATATEPRMATTPNETSADDLFDAPNAAAPAEQPAVEKAQDAAEDLFPAEDAAPATGTEAAPKQGADEKDTLDDLFGSNSADSSGARSESGATRLTETQNDRLPFRVWTDNTGNYQTVGRLVQVSNTHVRLLKDNSHYSTVAKSRLSQADLAYVDQMVKQLGLQIVDQLARR